MVTPTKSFMLVVMALELSSVVVSAEKATLSTSLLCLLVLPE